MAFLVFVSHYYSRLYRVDIRGYFVRFVELELLSEPVLLPNHVEAVCVVPQSICRIEVSKLPVYGYVRVRRDLEGHEVELHQARLVQLDTDRRGSFLGSLVFIA